MTIPVFLSAPTALATEQAEFRDCLTTVLLDAGFECRSVGRTDFGNSVPLITIRRLMASCFGAIVLGFAQLHLARGTSRPNTEREASVADLVLPTPWNHLEAGMAFQLGLPLLVIREERLVQEGIFGLGVSDRFVHHANLSPDWLQSPAFKQPLAEWANEVRERERRLGGTVV